MPMLATIHHSFTSTALPLNEGCETRSAAHCGGLFTFNNAYKTFEMEIVSGGASSEITVGFAHTGYSSEHHPGWYEGTVALHGDNGGLYLSAPHQHSTPVAPFGGRAGAVIGVQLRDDGSVRWCMDGRELFTASADLMARTPGFSPARIRPCVGIGRGACVKVRVKRMVYDYGSLSGPITAPRRR